MQTRSKTRQQKKSMIYLNGKYSIQELLCIISGHMCCGAKPKPRRPANLVKHFEKLDGIEKNVGDK